VRIGLFSDCEGDAAALEAVLGALEKHAPDLLICAGDILCCPFSPDPPAETIALLKAHGVVAVPGNHDPYQLDWGTSRWPQTLWMRLRRSDPLPTWLDDVPAGHARITAEDLAWLRALPEELALEGGSIYVCHGMPGNPWNTIWPRSATFDANVSDRDREASLLLVGPAQLVLCGHVPDPPEYHDRRPDGRELRIVRAGSRPRGQVGFALLTRAHAAWDIQWHAANVAARAR
jgi:diadenosine tetraphosphatase ApaH/serine/threonine PP2A family protein phosphatase